MKRFQFILSLIGFFFQVESRISAQENIIISDSLAANAEILELVVESLERKMFKFSIGDFTIMADHKMKRTYRDTKAEIPGVKDESTISTTFSYTVISNATDTALVTTEDWSTVQTYYPQALIPSFPLETMSVQKSASFTAWIYFKGDSSATWALFIEKASQEGGGLPIEMILTDGSRLIEPRLVSSDPYFDYSHLFRSLLKMPAMGIEFYENGKPLCALQYYGGAKYRPKKDSHKSYGSCVWMHKGLDANSEFVLAAAMSTILMMNNPYLVMNE